MAEPIFTLEECQFHDADLRALRIALGKASGLIVCSGPAGSGKTTTFYACARLVAADPHRKTITLERQVVGELPLATRLLYGDDPATGLACLLRSAILAEPDLLAIPDLVEPDAIRLALRAALTRQLVVTQLADESAADALLLVLQLNPLPYHVTDAVRLVVNQRLLPRLCPACRQPASPEPADAAWASRVWELHSLPPADIPAGYFAAPGCAACGGTGRQGRVAIAELLVPDDEVRDAARRQIPAARLRLLAIQRGARHLALDALRKAAAGFVALADARAALANDPLLGPPPSRP